MPLGISGMGSMADDVRKARSIAKSWTQSGGSLNAAIKDQRITIPKFVIDKCYGICFLFYLKAGFVWSGGIGTGFVLTKLNRGTPQQRWSAPSAITAGGVGWGLQVGAQKTFHVIVLNNALAASTFSSHAKVNMGGDISVAAGPVGRNAGVRLEAGTKGVAATYSYSYAQGVFAGLCLDGTIIGANPEMNRRFYGREIKITDLLKGRDGLDAWKSFPELADLYMLLDDALTSSGSSSFDMNYGNEPLSSRTSLVSAVSLRSGGSSGFGGSQNWWDESPNSGNNQPRRAASQQTGQMPPVSSGGGYTDDWMRDDMRRANTTSGVATEARRGNWAGDGGPRSGNPYDSFANAQGRVASAPLPPAPAPYDNAPYNSYTAYGNNPPPADNPYRSNNPYGPPPPADNPYRSQPRGQYGDEYADEYEARQRQRGSYREVDDRYN